MADFTLPPEYIGASPPLVLPPQHVGGAAPPSRALGVREQLQALLGSGPVQALPGDPYGLSAVDPLNAAPPPGPPPTAAFGPEEAAAYGGPPPLSAGVPTVPTESFAPVGLPQESSFNPYDNIPGPNNPYTPDELAAGYEMMRADPQNAQLTQEANLQMAIDAAGQNYAQNAETMSHGMDQYGTNMAIAANPPVTDREAADEYLARQDREAFLTAGKGDQAPSEYAKYSDVVRAYGDDSDNSKYLRGLYTADERAALDQRKADENKAFWDDFLRRGNSASGNSGAAKDTMKGLLGVAMSPPEKVGTWNADMARSPNYGG